MADPIAAWHTEHLNFSRLLALLQAQVDVFHTGERPDYELMLDIVSYLRDYSDQFHHPREEVMFMHLAKHFPDLALVLDRLTQEHRVIARAGEALHLLLQSIISGAIIPRAGLVRWPLPPISCTTATMSEKRRRTSPVQAIIGGAIISRAEVEMAAATYLVYYGNHIAREEEEEDIFGRAAQALTKEEWEDVRTAVPTVDDPLSHGSVEERYRELRRQMALAA